MSESSNVVPACPECQSGYCYELDGLYNCPECSHAWSRETVEDTDDFMVNDSNGTRLSDGDTVSVIKELKLKGAEVIKSGTKVKNIRLVNRDHNIDCKIEGVGAMSLKSEFVKKI